MALPITGDPEVDDLVSTDPLALLVAMVLDQQVPLEWAFRSPWELRQRMGGRLDVEEIAQADPDALAKVFAGPPALHRFPGSMAKRVQALCRHLVEQHDGRAAAVWEDAADGRQLLAGVKALPGFGDQKAQIFVALLGKRLGVRPPGWAEAAGDYGQEGTFRSVADIDGPEALGRVRAYKQDMKAKAKAAKPARVH